MHRSWPGRERQEVFCRELQLLVKFARLVSFDVYDIFKPRRNEARDGHSGSSTSTRVRVKKRIGNMAPHLKGPTAPPSHLSETKRYRSASRWAIVFLYYIARFRFRPTPFCGSVMQTLKRSCILLEPAPGPPHPGGPRGALVQC